MFHYRVGSKKFYNNVSALQQFTKDPTQSLEFRLEFNFLYNPVLWQKEPPQDVFYYMDYRSKLIKDRYKNIYVEYSGGTDSHTMLESLFRVNCPVHLHHSIIRSMSDYSNKMWRKNQLSFKELKSKNIKSFTLDDWSPFNNKGLDKTLLNYRGNFNIVSNFNVWQWEFYTDKTTRYNIKNNDCIILGKEKPKLIIKDGWWCWQDTDASFTDAYWDIDQGDFIYFFMSDECPELFIKLAWCKIKKIKEIAARTNTVITNDWIQTIQDVDSLYYEEINQSMGYRALNSILNSNSYKLNSNHNPRKVENQKFAIENKIIDFKKEYFNSEVVNKIRDDFFNIEKLTVDGIKTLSIPITPL